MPTLAILAEDEGLRAPESLERIPEAYEVIDYSDFRAWPPELLVVRLREVDAVVTGRQSPRLPEALAEDFGRLRWLCHTRGTVRYLVSKRLIEAGLVVTNWGDNVWHIAEGAMALLLALVKQLPALDACCRGRDHEPVYQDYRASLWGLDVGLYGFGPIGRHTAALLRPFRARVAAYDPHTADLPDWVRRCDSLEDLFATCQAVSLHCGLNDETRGSVTGALLDRLPRGGILVNTARGAVVDEAALAARVAAGRLLAGLDVIENESNWPGSPLAGLDGVILTHHKAGLGANRAEGAHRVRIRTLPPFAAENLERFAAGEPLKHVITAEAYDLKT